MEKFTEVLMIVVAVSVVAFAFFLPKLAPTSNSPYGPFIPTSSGPNVATRGLYLSTGNASFAYEPSKEYVILTNGGQENVNISGWTIQNKVGTSAVIPEGTPLYSSRYTPGGIVLAPGEQAIIVTGSSPSINSRTLPSFKENICTSYLEESYEFPTLTRSCPLPMSEPGTANLDKDCRNFLNRIYDCRAPKLSYNNEEGLTPACRAFIAGHLNYTGCVAAHSSDPDFQRSVWYVYLERPWEMWADGRETITIYDRSGQLVIKQTY